MRAVESDYSTIFVGGVSGGEIIPPGFLSFLSGKHLDWMEYIRLYIATDRGEDGGEHWDGIFI